MFQAALKLVQRAPVANTSLILHRNYSLRKQSYLSMFIGKVNKFFRGSATPFVKPDPVLAQIMKEEKWRIPQTFAKAVYLRTIARKKVVEHNVRIRKLEKKVTGDAIGIKGFTNKF